MLPYAETLINSSHWGQVFTIMMLTQLSGIRHITCASAKELFLELPTMFSKMPYMEYQCDNVHKETVNSKTAT